MKKKGFLAIFFLLILSLLHVLNCTNSAMSEPQAQKVLNEFYTDNVREPINDRKLLEAGKAIMPYLIEEVQKRDMPKRRYAIGALGKIGDRRALPALVKILGDRSELEYVRGDALEAIWRINKKVGKELVKKYDGESTYIDRVSQPLREGKLLGKKPLGRPQPLTRLSEFKIIRNGG